MTARVSIACSIAIVVLLGVITVRNALTYPAVGGYDASEYIAYARDLVTNGSQTGWEYDAGGGTWTAFPGTGLPANKSGNQVRHTVQSALSASTWYRRVRAGV